MKLGLVTYNLAKDWDCETIIRNCEKTGFEGVELRTTHAHGVEVSLSAGDRERIRKLFEDSPVKICGLGSAFEFHSSCPVELRRNIDGTKEYAKLAADVGAPGIKVRPNAIPEGSEEGAVLEQIAKACRECALFAGDLGVEVRIEVHGKGTSDPGKIRRILDIADTPNFKACWNSNQNEVIDGEISHCFRLLKDRIGLVHMRDICLTDYPWRDLIRRLKRSGFHGYCCAEIPESPDPERVMRYYSALWRAYVES